MEPFFFLVLRLIPASERAIATACFCEVTTGPFLLPLCNSPCPNSCITFFTLAFCEAVALRAIILSSQSKQSVRGTLARQVDRHTACRDRPRAGPEDCPTTP